MKKILAVAFLPGLDRWSNSKSSDRKCICCLFVRPSDTMMAIGS